MAVRPSTLVLTATVVTCIALSPAWAADPVATVGGRPISERALEDAVQETLNSRFFHRNVIGDRLIEIRREQLSTLITRELDVLGALDNGMKLPMDEAEKQRAAVQDRVGSATYKQAIKARGWSKADHARFLAAGLLAERARQRFVLEPSKVSDAEVKETYLANPAQWRLPEALHIQHILLKVAADAGKDAWSAREAEAQKLVKQIKGGEDFADVAAKSSDDPYRVKGGDLGWIHRGRLIEPLESAAWKAKPGDLIGPLRSTEGYHVMRIVAHRSERAMTFEEVAPMQRKQLEDARRKLNEERWYTALRAKHRVVIFDPELEPKGR